MKLLPLKIAVTSAMIVGLGAVSTANAQQQQSSSTLTTVEDFLPRLTQTLSNPQYHNEFEDALDQYHNMVVGDTAIVSTLDSGNNITGTALKFYSDAENTLPSSMLFDQIMTNQRLNGFKEGQPFIPVDDNGNPITQIDQVAGPNGIMQTVRSVTTKIATADDVDKSPYAQGIQKDIDDLYSFDQEVTDRIATLDRATEILTEAGNHHDDLIRKNKADIQDLAAHNELQTEAIDALNKASSANTKRITTAELGIAENKKDALIAKAQADKNKNDIQDLAKAQLAGVEVMAELNKNIAGTQTDIANNKITLAQHAKKIDDNQQAIEAKLGGKADLQKLSELKTSVDKNQADIQLHDQKINNLGILHSMVARAVGANKDRIDQNKADIAENKEDIQNNINNIYELAQQQDQHSSDIKTLAKASSANTDNIAKNKADADASFKTLTKNQNALIEKDKAQDTLIAANKADADASFKTLTKNQNALIEKDKAQDTLIAANKADADAKFTGVQTDIANNKTTLAQHAKKINDNQQAIEAKLGGKADAQALNNLNDKVNGFDGRISALDTKVNAFDGRITALDSKVENGMAAQAALSGLFQPYSVGKFNATAALGGYGSKSAVAIGAGYRVNPNLAIKAGAAINTSGDKKGSYNIGVNYEF
nr:YadA-like family protein [Moraxella catarrhalis]